MFKTGSPVKGNDFIDRKNISLYLEPIYKTINI